MFPKVAWQAPHWCRGACRRTGAGLSCGLRLGGDRSPPHRRPAGCSLLTIGTTRLCGAVSTRGAGALYAMQHGIAHCDDDFAAGTTWVGLAVDKAASERVGQLVWNVPASREETAMNVETPYDLPSGERIWVIDTASAGEHLSALLKGFREGESEPLIFGDGGEPEGVVIPWDEWSRLDALAADAGGFDDANETELERTDARSEPSAPLEGAESEIDWDLNEDLDDSEPPKPPTP